LIFRNRFAILPQAISGKRDFMRLFSALIRISHQTRMDADLMWRLRRKRRFALPREMLRIALLSPSVKRLRRLTAAASA
jgi:hypothetical protein